MRRKLMETLERRKEMMIAALWANSGFEGKEGAEARKQAIEELEEHYDEAVKSIMFKAPVEEDIDDNNPFFAASSRGLAKVLDPAKSDGSVQEAIEDPFADMDIDQ